jgi:hypothetical protein
MSCQETEIKNSNVGDKGKNGEESGEQEVGVGGSKLLVVNQSEVGYISNFIYSQVNQEGPDSSLIFS